MKRLLILLGFLIVLGAVSLIRPLQDFAAYWTAAHLFVRHQNPYSLSAVKQLQKPLGWSEPLPLMLLNPPWVLPFILPIGVLSSYSLAWSLWILLIAGMLVWSSRILLSIYCDDVRLRDISDTSLKRGLFIFSFYPVVLCLKFAQTAAFPLLGLAGFLWYEKRNRPFAAGLSLSLIALKPNLVFLVLFALVLRRSWKALGSSTLVVALLSGIALLMDRNIFSAYFALLRTPYVALQPAALGWVLRLSFGALATAWIQWLPPMAGLIWFGFYWRRHRDEWIWAETMPALVTASLLTTSYARLYDQALLVIPIAYLFGQYVRHARGEISRRYVLIYTALNSILIAGAMVTSPFVYPVAPALLSSLLFARFPVLTLTATSRSSPVSRAQYTSPMPPASSTDRIS